MKGLSHNNKKRNPSLSEIKKRLQWFHGEEFAKYPFIEEQSNVEY